MTWRFAITLGISRPASMLRVRDQSGEEDLQTRLARVLWPGHSQFVQIDVRILIGQPLYFQYDNVRAGNSANADEMA